LTQEQLRPQLDHVLEWYNKRFHVVLERASFDVKFLDRKEYHRYLGEAYRPSTGYDHPGSLGFQDMILRKPWWNVYKQSAVIAGVIMVIPLGLFMIAFLASFGEGNAGAMLMKGIMFISSLWFVLFLYASYFLRFVRLFTNSQTIVIGVLAGYDSYITRSVLAHEIAHVVHNRHPVRAYAHAVIDLILLPFCLSYQEGIASWAEREYVHAHSEEMLRKTLRYRLSLLVIRAFERLLGKRFVYFLLKYC